MQRHFHIALRGGLMLILGCAIAACGSNSSSTPPNNGGGTVTVRQEDQFGVPFGTAFRADNNSEPYSPADGDIAAISLTTEPVDIK